MKIIKQRKAQAAMEFLMTYGWAILVVLGAIAALAYFGVLSPDKFLPNKCNMPSGFGCVDFVADSGTNSITLVLQNGAGFTAVLTEFNVEGCEAVAGTPDEGQVRLDSLTGDDIAVAPGVQNNGWTNGEKIFAVFDCTATGLNSGDRFQSDINLRYTTANGLQKSAIGDIVVKVE